MQPKLLLIKTWEHFSNLFIVHWLYLILVVVHFFVFNGIKEMETEKLSLIKPGYSMIVTHSDKRRGNIFKSTPDYFIKLSHMVPEVTAILKTLPREISFSYIENGTVQNVVRELPILLVGSRYFDAFEGRFIQGRGFTKEEIFRGLPVVVMTEGALVKIFGDYNNFPSTITINGVEFQIIGSWAFNNNDIEENESILVPLGLVNLFGKSSSTYINNFILKGNSSATLDKLKKGIDKIQIDSGLAPVRPEFSIASTSVSKKTEYIFVHNKIYIDVFIWVCFFGFIFISLKSNNEWLSFSQDWLTWKFMAGHKPGTYTKDAVDAWLFILTISLLGTTILSIVILGFLKLTLGYHLGVGEIFHKSILAYFLFLPFQFWILGRMEKKLRYNL